MNWHEGRYIQQNWMVGLVVEQIDKKILNGKNTDS